MRRPPEPKEVCGRPDCTEPKRQWGFCVNHSILFRRNGVPYRQDEIDDMAAAEQWEREMDEALAADPPVVVWRLDPFRRVLVHTHIHDPHTERADRKAAS